MLVTKRVKRTLEQILEEEHVSRSSYDVQVDCIRSLLAKGALTEIRSSPKNGRIPPLRTGYYRCLQEEDYREYLPEILNRLDVRLDPGYYAKHPDRYAKDRDYVLLLSEYLKRRPVFSGETVSMNERAEEIFGYEKFFDRGDENRGGSSTGFDILRRLGHPNRNEAAALLHFHFTAEPFAYAVISRETPQNLLILENKDPFCGMRAHLLDPKADGAICGLPVSTLIFGGGASKEPAFRDFDLNAEPYMKAPGNTYYYAGDLDYAGIRIYGSFRDNARALSIRPCLPVYRAMIRKAEGRRLCPAKAGQRPFSGGEEEEFFSWFSQKERDTILSILRAGNYIPQEILSITDY